MLGSDAVCLQRSVMNLDLLTNAADDLSQKSKNWLKPSQTSQNIISFIEDNLKNWKVETKQKLIKASHTDDIEKELTLYQEVIYWQEEKFFQKVDELVHLKLINSSFYAEASSLLMENQQLSLILFPYIFCDSWYNSLVERINSLQEEELKIEKEQKLKALYERIETLKKMANISDMGDKASVGRWWDLARSAITTSDMDSFIRYARVLKKHKYLQHIADQLGRQSNASIIGSQHHQNLVCQKERNSQKVEANHYDMDGIIRHSDLNRLLPTEVVYLSDLELEDIFYQRFADNLLMNYHMKGQVKQTLQHHISHPNCTSSPEPKGPFLLCVDASGSMSGFPEVCAKAIAYALMQIALKENRNCFINLFSTTTITYELTCNSGLKEAADYLSYCFHGGTDLELALSTTIDKTLEDQYRYADLVVISDFMVPELSSKYWEKIQSFREMGNQCHGIYLSKFANQEVLKNFDSIWEYSPYLLQRLWRSF